MKQEQLESLKMCPYCFQDEGTVNQVFEVAMMKWKYYDAELGEYCENLSKPDDEVMVFCSSCENEILERDVK